MAKKVTIPGSQSITAEVAEVTPQVARQWLAKAKEARNRSISKSRVMKLFRAMQRGEWVLCQPLLFDSKGRLIDGQHRLLAAIAFGKPVEFIVLRGFEGAKTFGRVDDTQPRRLHHWLQVQGEERPEILAAMIRMAHKHENQRLAFAPTSSEYVTGPEGVAFLETHGELRRSVLAPGVINRLLPHTMCSFLHYLFAQKDRSAANVFFIDLVTGEKESPTDPIYLLRERLKSNKLALKKMGRVELAALVIKAWNAVREKKKIERLQWQQAKEFFPEVA